MVRNKYGILAPVEFQIKVDPTNPMTGEYTVMALFKAVDEQTGESFFPPVNTVMFSADPVEPCDVRKYFADKFDESIVANGIGEKVYL